MFLITQINLTCRSFQRTSNDSSEEEPEASWVRDTVAKERALEEYKENGRSTSINEDHLGHKRSSKIKKSMTKLPKYMSHSHATILSIVTTFTHIQQLLDSFYPNVIKSVYYS